MKWIWLEILKKFPFITDRPVVPGRIHLVTLSDASGAVITSVNVHTERLDEGDRRHAFELIRAAAHRASLGPRVVMSCSWSGT